MPDQQHDQRSDAGRDPMQDEPSKQTNPAPNLSTEHQRTGDAKRPSDTLDKDQGPAEDDGGRLSSFT